MKVKIRLDTLSDINNFVQATSTIKEKVVLRDSAGNQVNAKSVLGAMYTMEWDEIYCLCDKDISSTILPFIVLG